MVLVEWIFYEFNGRYNHGNVIFRLQSMFDQIEMFAIGPRVGAKAQKRLLLRCLRSRTERQQG